MVIFPYGTDSPLYHLPVITILMVVINVLVFFGEPVQQAATSDEHPVAHFAEWVMGQQTGGEDDTYKLQFGEGLKPWQWITSSFLHLNFGHLLGNMIFLVLFGIIVEGKIGWWKFLGIYLGISLIAGFLSQGVISLVNPGYQGAALGASSVVCGLMAIAVFWAPINNIQMLANFYFRYTWHFDVPVAAFAGFFLLIDILSTLFVAAHAHSFAPFTAFLHTCGIVVGVVVGIGMLKLNWVDCDGFDAFSVILGRHQGTHFRGVDEEDQTDNTLPVERGIQQIREILAQEDQPLLAHRANEGMRIKFPQWHLPDREFLLLIQQLVRKDHTPEAIQAMQQYLKTPRAKEQQVRLKLASLLVDSQQQPRQAIATLSPIDYDQLSAKEQAIYDRVSSAAKQLHASGDLDMLPFDD